MITEPASTARCVQIDPVWDRRCVRPAGHDGVHRNDEITGDTLTWGTASQVRAYERGAGR